MTKYFPVHINTAKLFTRSQVLNIVPSIEGEFKQESTFVAHKRHSNLFPQRTF